MHDLTAFLRGCPQVTSMADRRAMRDEYRKWLILLQPNYILCPAFHREISLQNAERKLRTLCQMIERHALGRNWAKKPPEDRLRVVGFYESVKTDLHCHAAVWTPDGWEEAIHDFSRQAWKKLVPSGTLMPEDTYNVHGGVNYITKEQTALGRLENTFLYAPRT